MFVCVVPWCVMVGVFAGVCVCLRVCVLFRAVTVDESLSPRAHSVIGREVCLHRGYQQCPFVFQRVFAYVCLVFVFLLFEKIIEYA